MLPAMFEIASILEYFKSLTDPLEVYWTSGRLVDSGWNWSPTSQSLLLDTTICSLLSNKYNCLYYINGCFKNNGNDIRSYNKTLILYVKEIPNNKIDIPKMKTIITFFLNF